MVYNAYNQYSPYWQQTAGQTTSQNAGHNIGQTGSSYQPLSAYHSNQQTPQSSFSQASGNSGGAYGGQGYGNVNINGAGNARPQDTRASYNINDRASIDGATALGNLAYASSLGRDGSTTQQTSNNSRQPSNAEHNTANSYGVASAPSIQYRTGEGRRGSNGSSREDNTRSQPATASPSFGYSANNTGYQGPTGNNTQAQAQYLPPSRSSAEQHKNQYSQPPRPPSGQAIQQSHSRLGSQAAPSPPLTGNHSTPNQSAMSKNSAIVRGKEKTRVQTPQSNKQMSASQVPRGPTQTPQVPHSGTNSQAERNTKKQPAAYASAKGTAATRINEARQSPTVISRRDQSSKPATPVEPQYTTVDPSQVFNHEEYSRRQAAAAAEAAAIKKAAEEAEAARVAATLPKPPTTKTNGTEPDSAKKDQMELEMKQMIEKMRDYKAKDPSLFTQIWEQVKKTQPPQRAPSQSIPGSATSPMVVNSPSSSPSLINSQLPPESDLPAGDEFPPNFDRGRFPAQRRRRGGKITSTSRKSGKPKASTEPAAETSSPGNHGSPVPPEIAIPAPKVGKIFPDPSSQSMQQAMKQFHQNSEPPVAKAQQLPGSNKQVTTAPPHTVSAETAPPPKPGGTYWPESKKQALAEAARTALTSTRNNQAKTITTQEIHELLDQNPSYTQMCEILEYRGFVIDRGQFARILLKAVPDLGSAASPPNTAPAKPASTSPTVTASKDDTTPTTKANAATPTTGSFGKLIKTTPNGSTQTNVPQPLPYAVPPTAAHRMPNGYATPYPPAPASAKQVNEVNQSDRPRDYRFVNPASWTVNEPDRHASVTNQDRQNDPALHSHPSLPPHQPLGSVNGQVLDQNGTVQPNDVVPPHQPTKQEMARKRTFGEIVDLTQTLSDDEELERQRPKPRTGLENALGSNQSVKNVFDQAAQRQQDGRSTPKPFKYKYSGRDALLQSYDIVEPMNKRRDALRRSTYNPKTIARDVLLGIGKHPTMTPLNAHLDVLKDRFKAIDLESDLSTFRWDLVDPEGEDNAKRYDTDDEEDAVPAAAAIARQRPAPIAVMINGDGGNMIKDDHALHRTLNPSGNPYKRGPYKKTGIRSGIQPIGSTDIPQRPSSQSSPHVQTTDDVPRTSAPDLSRFAFNSPYTPQTDVNTSNPSSSSTPGSVPKRKGRPPGARNKQTRPDKGISKKDKPPTLNRIPSTEKAKTSDEERGKRTPSVGEISPVGRPSSPIPSRPRISTTTPSRPSGLRNSISAITPMDGIAVVVESRSPSVIMTPQASAKKGSPKKTDDFSHRAYSPAPSYTMYRCHWENCPAELHSLETLKKHVRKHRRDVDGVYPCLWADCSDSSNPISNQSQDEIGQHKRLKFKTHAEWIEHVESNHLRTGREISEGAAAKIELENIDHLSENESRRRQATSKAKSPVVLISPV